ncbi:MAG TPA: alpha-ketoacid dehydrogenase subunit beta [Pseudonocardia sp.]|jgi:pyruvate dehydrogenase E1 component beta subunit|uniref:alpha-ketoacid dehydrogenase subunit beta n=1 Tax=Pseudonocardia sp. TaxID=60912 RepID=UPI002B4AB1BE|nr:alpha-ketoacid dehydrogenase subunit beta [Pseudonocardia sp.]HLU60121.1 alpha-ketoacid dehydrogenase subunit beta [Pseudonocardia sp.]
MTAATATREMTYAEAVRETLAELMEADERVFLMGEDIGVYGGAFGVTTGLLERFGRERVRDTPISEIAIVGAGVGAALCGRRPIVELQFSDFVTCAMDQIVNQAAKIHFMLGGAAQVPLVIRAPAGSGTGAAAQHSQSLEAWFAHVPGLKVVMPASPADAAGLLRAAVADPNPVLVLEHKLLYKERGPVPPDHHVPLGSAAVRRRGVDLTIVATSVMVGRSLAAADELAAEGIEATVVDPRTITPLDEATILAEVTATGKALLVQEAPRTGGFVAEIAARIAESEAFHALKAPVVRLCGLDVPMPYAPELEKAAVPQVPDIVAAARGLHRGG